jgi:hypothetical protein
VISKPEPTAIRRPTFTGMIDAELIEIRLETNSVAPADPIAASAFVKHVWSCMPGMAQYCSIR